MYYLMLFLYLSTGISYCDPYPFKIVSDGKTSFTVKKSGFSLNKKYEIFLKIYHSNKKDKCTVNFQENNETFETLKFENLWYLEPEFPGRFFFRKLLTIENEITKNRNFNLASLCPLKLSYYYFSPVISDGNEEFHLKPQRLPEQNSCFILNDLSKKYSTTLFESWEKKCSLKFGFDSPKAAVYILFIEFQSQSGSLGEKKITLSKGAESFTWKLDPALKEFRILPAAMFYLDKGRNEMEFSFEDDSTLPSFTALENFFFFPVTEVKKDSNVLILSPEERPISEEIQKVFASSNPSEKKFSNILPGSISLIPCNQSKLKNYLSPKREEKHFFKNNFTLFTLKK